ncbi:Y-family DNA polymerase [Solidesulfovibrio sp.]
MADSMRSARRFSFPRSLADKPVVVLSNNDGCVIARSAQAKAFGIPMGKPASACREFCRRRDVAWTPG